MGTVTGFVPSVNGLPFDNAFADEPALTLDLGLCRLPVGNAANGLCGGMVFAALDYWYQGALPPAGPNPPAPGTPLFRYLLRRLIDSWALPNGPLTYLALMNPAYPDGAHGIGPLNVHGRGRRMLTREWPALKAALEAGRPCPLGLITVRSANPRHVGKNHQLLAYGYEQVDTAVRINVYDPNQAGRDDVVLAFELVEPSLPVNVSLDRGATSGPGVVCFFKVGYAAKAPPVLRGGSRAGHTVGLRPASARPIFGHDATVPSHPTTGSPAGPD